MEKTSKSVTGDGWLALILAIDQTAAVVIARYGL